MSTDELLKLNLRKSTTQDTTKTNKKENEMAKNMVRETKFEFHQREKALGLSQVPLEKPFDGRSHIKGVILEIRTNINRLS
jgi:hypothetical protein